MKVLIFFLLTVGTFFAAGAPDEANQQIDAIFSQLPPAVLSAEQADPIIKQLEALAESVPARKLEIDAFLIPYRRVVEASARGGPAPSATPQPTVTLKPKPLLFVRVPGAKPQAIRAVSVTLQGPVIVVEAVDGRRSIYQKEFIESPLSWFTDAEMEGGGLDLARLAARYDSYVTILPEGRVVLEAESKKMKALVAKAREASRKREEEIQNTLMTVLAQTYEEDKDYTREEIARILLDADSARKARPAHAVEIDQVVAPFREHFENLIAGKVCEGGVWKTKEEIEAGSRKRRLDDQRLSFEQGLTIPFDALVLSESRIFQSLKMPALVLGLLVATGLVLLSRRKRLLLAALLVLAPTAGSVYYLYLLMSGGSSIDVLRTPGGANTGRISRLLFFSSLSDRTVFTKEDEQVSLTDQDLNQFLHEHLKFINDPGGESAGVYVTDVAVEIVPRGLTLFEQVRYKGQFYCIRYDLKIEKRGNEPVITGCSIKFGKATVLRPAKDWLWSALVEQLKRIQREYPLLRDYSLTHLKESELQLTLKTVEPQPEKVNVASAPSTPKPSPVATPAAPVARPATEAEPAASTPAPEPAAEPAMPPPTQPEPENSGAPSPTE